MTLQQTMTNVQCVDIIFIPKGMEQLNQRSIKKFKMDYQEELKRLQESGNYWKPKVGQYKVKALTELEDTDPYVKKVEGQPNENHPQAKIQILIEGEEKVWTFGKGKTPAQIKKL